MPVDTKENTYSTSIKNKIPIILATTDNYYIYYLYITAFSIVYNANENTFYDFKILVPTGFKKNSINKIKILEQKYKNCSIQFIDMGLAFQDLNKNIAHIEYPTYYRLLAADLLPNYDKCIYLDIDIVVNVDLSDLYNIDLDNSYIAGIKAAAYISNKHHQKRLSLENIDGYINAGVLLMNLQKIREYKITDQFVKLSKNNYSSQDQDVLNVACYQKIKHLPFKYNLQIKYHNNFKKYITAGIYTQTEIEEAYTTPCIIHYLNPTKPWHTKKIPFGDIWWEYAKMTPYYKKIHFINFIKLQFFKNKKNNYTILEQIFSVKNERRGNSKAFKVICILGIKIKFRNTPPPDNM